MRKKVLIVEDDIIWRELLTSYMQALNIETRAVVSAGQAIVMIDEWHPDGIVMDMLLAGETGMALLNEMRSYGDLAQLPVVVCSSLTLSLEQLLPFGVRAVLNKTTMVPAEVARVLRSVFV